MTARTYEKETKEIALWSIAERDVPLVWVLVRIHKVATGYGNFHNKKEELIVFHNSGEAKDEYIRMLRAPNNEFTSMNLKVVSRRQYFGEGMYCDPK